VARQRRPGWIDEEGKEVQFPARKGTASFIQRGWRSSKSNVVRAREYSKGAMAVPGFILRDIRLPHCLPDSFPFPVHCPLFSSTCLTFPSQRNKVEEVDRVARV
jgi:hypothetical protein